MAKGKELTGVLFKNDRKSSDSSPLYKGSCMIEGTEYWIAAWLNDGEKGKYMSLKFTAKDESKPAKPAPRRAPETEEDIPW